MLPYFVGDAFEGTDGDACFEWNLGRSSARFCKLYMRCCSWFGRYLETYARCRSLGQTYNLESWRLRSPPSLDWMVSSRLARVARGSGEAFDLVGSNSYQGETTWYVHQSRPALCQSFLFQTSRTEHRAKHYVVNSRRTWGDALRRKNISESWSISFWWEAWKAVTWVSFCGLITVSSDDIWVFSIHGVWLRCLCNDMSLSTAASWNGKRRVNGSWIAAASGCSLHKL